MPAYVVPSTDIPEMRMRVIRDLNKCRREIFAIPDKRRGAFRDDESEAA